MIYMIFNETIKEKMYDKCDFDNEKTIATLAIVISFVLGLLCVIVPYLSK